MTEDGHTRANFDFNFSNVCMIRMDHQGYAYGLLGNGRVVTNRPDRMDILEPLRDVFCIGYREGAQELVLERKGGDPLYLPD